MGIETTYVCDVCGLTVDDADLLANPDLRRVQVFGNFFRAAAPAVAGDPPTAVESNGTANKVFCSYAHASEYILAATF
jgi:hypothetical protein